MRLHHLEVTAFGPFAGTEQIDFDSLNDAGLFLLSGATGAGKTSILDAVCFALYGSVPGARGVKALKSQHADDTTRPEVVLDFSVRDRRFVVRRSPEWTRPKKRGAGTATEKAAASLLELRTDGEHFLTHRAAEVGLLVSGLIGMQAAQFQQVAMLPQGDFQRFLQATSQERHDVLQHLFRTDRFARIEGWMQDHSRKLREAAADGENGVRRLLHLVSGRAERDLPDLLAGDSLASATADGAVAAWGREVLEAAERELEDATAAHRAATAADEATRGELQDVRRAAAVHARRGEAVRLEAGLAASADSEAAAREALETHGRAASCLPVLEMLEAARDDQERTFRAWQRALQGLSSLDDANVPGLVASTGLATLDDLTRAERTATRHLSRLEALLPRVVVLRDAQAAQRSTQVGLAAAQADLSAARARLASLPSRLEGLRGRHAEAAATAARREALALRVTAAQDRKAAAARIPSATRALTALEDAARDARDLAADARDRVQDLQARRLAGIAAELAGNLEDGAPCAVCGSQDHPAPAAPGADPVTESEQAGAAEAHDRAQAALLDAIQRVADARHQLETLERASDGRDVDAAQAELSAATSALSEAEAAEAERLTLDAGLAALAEEERAASTDVAELGTRVATLEQTLSTHAAAAEEALEEIADVIGDGDPDGLERLVARLGDAVSSIEDARLVLTEHERAVAKVTELVEHATRTFADHGFDSVNAVRQALLDDATRSGHESLLADRREQAAQVRAVLADPEVLALSDEHAPDVGEAEAAATLAADLCQAATRTFHLHEQRVQGLMALLPQLEAAVSAWAPVRDDYARAESMSKLVRGMGGDNHLQMRLSAYVLARRLDQVLDAANERLSHMRDQRYLLQRTARAARKGSQAGLGLEVLDQWTGDVRDPSTLSGGETFVVSLALALGLADVVTQESGGTEIETLFVDEGFGTLDPETLDDVMDRLDGLRAGGRTVGVVSHVSELRTRIPTQIHVRKTPSGSSVHATTLVS